MLLLPVMSSVHECLKRIVEKTEHYSNCIFVMESSSPALTAMLFLLILKQRNVIYLYL